MPDAPQPATASGDPGSSQEEGAEKGAGATKGGWGAGGPGAGRTRSGSMAGPPPGGWKQGGGSLNTDRLTLILVAVMTVMTFILWGASRVACNYSRTVHHPPRDISFEDRIKTAKGAAVEFELQLARGGLEQASRLATGTVAQKVEELEAACNADPAACAATAHQAAELGIGAVGDVVQRAGATFTVDVTTYAGDATSVHRLVVEKQGTSWKVVSRGAPTAAPPQAPSPDSDAPVPG